MKALCYDRAVVEAHVSSAVWWSRWASGPLHDLGARQVAMTHVYGKVVAEEDTARIRTVGAPSTGPLAAR
jgi:hypothetical protein